MSVMMWTSSHRKFSFTPKVIWHFFLASSQFGNLAELLVDLFSAPCGAVACEENHKTMKRIHKDSRASLRSSIVEKQTAVAYNAAVLNRKTRYKRHPFIVHVAALDLPAFVDDSSQDSRVAILYGDDADLNANMGGELEDEEEVLESGFVECFSGGGSIDRGDVSDDWETPDEIPDCLLFGEIEDFLDG